MIFLRLTPPCPLFRLIQYLCRAIWDSLQQNELNIELIEKLKAVEYILSSFRKRKFNLSKRGHSTRKKSKNLFFSLILVLRFGKCLDVFYSSFKSIHYPDLTIRLTLTLSKISQALYLFADHFIWLARSGLFRTIDLKKWNQAANRYWLFSIVMNLARDLYEITKIIDLRTRQSKFDGLRTRNCQINSVRDLATASLRTYSCLYEHKGLLVDTIKNSCDFFIPLTALGYAKLSPRTIGILGVVSSLAGLVVVLQPQTKLVPM